MPGAPGAPGSHGASSHSAAQAGELCCVTPGPLTFSLGDPLPLPLRGGRFGRVSGLGRRGRGPIVVPSESWTRTRFVCLCLRVCDRNPLPSRLPWWIRKTQKKGEVALSSSSFRCRRHSCVAFPVPGARGAEQGFPGPRVLRWL